MPGLYSLAAHPALHAVHAGLRDGEAVFAFLDDVYIVAPPERVRELYAAVEEALWTHARVQLNRAKTRIWNAAGAQPADIRDLQPAGGEPVWVGDWALPRDQQGLNVLGTPLGSDAFVQRQLALKREAHDRLLQAIPTVEDLQAAWLLLRYCAAPRANYLLHVLPPAETADYAAEHDAAIAACLARLLGQADHTSWFMSASRTFLATRAPASRHTLARARSRGMAREARAPAVAHAVRWSPSTSSGLRQAQVRGASGSGRRNRRRRRTRKCALGRMLQALQGPLADSLPSTAAAQHAAVHLGAQGYAASGWGEVMQPPAEASRRDDLCDHLRGWQRRAAHACDERAFETAFSNLSPASRALLLSQAGPHSSRALTVLPTHEDVTRPGALCRRTGSASHQDAQYAAWRSVRAQRQQRALRQWGIVLAQATRRKQRQTYPELERVCC